VRGGAADMQAEGNMQRSAMCGALGNWHAWGWVRGVLDIGVDVQGSEHKGPCSGQ
jgi:hypothetical protein